MTSGRPTFETSAVRHSPPPVRDPAAPAKPQRQLHTTSPTPTPTDAVRSGHRRCLVAPGALARAFPRLLRVPVLFRPAPRLRFPGSRRLLYPQIRPAAFAACCLPWTQLIRAAPPLCQRVGALLSSPLSPLFVWEQFRRVLVSFGPFFSR